MTITLSLRFLYILGGSGLLCATGHPLALANFLTILAVRQAKVLNLQRIQHYS